MFDIGVNLTSSRFKKDYLDVLERARLAGITGMVIIGTNISDSKKALNLSKQNLNYCWSTAGVHPHYANRWSDYSDSELRSLASELQVVAIGECGLDFHRNFSEPKQQSYVFQAQLELAVELNLPVFLHCRQAHNAFMSIIKPFVPRIKGAVLHCFTGTYKELRSYLDENFFIGITGWVSDQNRGSELRALIPLIPSTHLLLETDAPWLLPQDIYPSPLSKRNEPSFLSYILQKVAFLREEVSIELARQTTLNAHKFFSI
ncbi:TatD family hydrolase [Candidatus Erwinia haradaeae]|uniref:3'-5' ssDNA/RNA exonuclease TatD n=1 Tax=Candidatus Erwinia haradaeae TaxID=1922217 RepID=A0A451D817_9GAMM|nr:TatD family hydrolase [Candidatus Erwinia haradaeae]VFP81991.1 3'-5' ssDNA/RNA exonuclease TatD [Candidatus Erwinia haradaeae]